MSGEAVFIITAVAVFIAGLLRGFSGFGAGMVLMPILSIVYSPQVAVCMVVLLELIPSIQLVPGSIAHCDWKSVVPMAITGVLTVPLGSLLLIYTDADTMQIAIALLVLFSVTILATGWRYKGRLTRKVALMTGTASGLISGATSLGGLPIILFYLFGDHSRRVARASIVMFLFITTVIALLAYTYHGLITPDILQRVLWLAPVFIVAIWMGGRLFGKISEGFFRAVTLTLLGGIGIAMLLAGCNFHSGKEIIALEGETMGTSYHIQIIEEQARADKKQLTADIESQLEAINQLMSTWRNDSEISQFNQAAAQQWIPLSVDTYHVLELAVQISRQTQGAFDITVGPLVDLWGFGAAASAHTAPTDDQIKQVLNQIGYQHLQLDPPAHAVKKQIPLQVNLSAIAKGYAVDKLADLLDKHGYKDYLVEIGGEIRGKGRKPDGTHWRLAIESPVPQSRQVYQLFQVTDQGVATSGDYRNYFEEHGRRFSHIIDPITGRPVAHNLVSVTVISDTSARADALATALMVMGEERGYEYCEQHDIAAYFIFKQDDDLAHRATSTFKQYLIGA